MRHRRRRLRDLVPALALALALALAACAEDPPSSPPADNPPATAHAEAPCPAFAEGVSRGRLESGAIVEASGIAASRRNPGVLWVHNDSGGRARLFAVGEDGRHLGTFVLAGARARDWEDVAVGPGPEAGRSYLYVGDIGDNAEIRTFVTVYRVPEPRVDPDGAAVADTLRGVEALDLTYPEGPANAEALFVDPLTGDLFVVTKRADGRSRVYRAAHPVDAEARTTMARVATLQVGGTQLPGSPAVTAADISPDGAFILLRTYTRIHLWRRGEGTTVGAAFEGVPCRVPSRTEGQGEAIGFAADGQGYYTVSEGNRPNLYFFARAATP